jgi:hypothetical protein
MPSYDLSTLEVRVYPNAHRGDRFLIAMLGVLLTFWAIVMIFNAPRVVEEAIRLSRSPTASWFVLVALATGEIFALGVVVSDLLLSLLLDGIPHGWRGPVRLEADSYGFTLVWGRGPPLKRLWVELRLPLRVDDYSEQGPNHGSKLKLNRFLRPPLFEAVTNEAAAALADQARQAGLHVRTRDVVTSLGAHGRRYLISTSR